MHKYIVRKTIFTHIFACLAIASREILINAILVDGKIDNYYP